MSGIPPLPRRAFNPGPQSLEFVREGEFCMQNCRLPNGQVVNALEYDREIHGNLIFCPNCNAEVIHVDSGNRNTLP